MHKVYTVCKVKHMVNVDLPVHKREAGDEQNAGLVQTHEEDDEAET